MAEDTAEQLEAEMKLLNWHKLANETALKAALLKTKQMKERDRRNQPKGNESLRAKAAWMQRVIEEEQAKPLQVSKEFVLTYQAKEKRDEERLDEEVCRHISGLKRLRSQIEKRDTLRSKKEAYRRHRAELTAASRSASSKKQEEEVEPPVKKGTLSTVISSLDRLVDLERRIASLENDAFYERVEAAADVPVARKKKQQPALSFVRRRVPPTLNNASKDVYSVRVNNTQKRNRQPLPGLKQQQQMHHPLSSGVSRQDAAISNWLERKKARQQQRLNRGTGRVEAPAVGAASGRRGKNASQQQFLDMKKGLEKRQDAMRNPNRRGQHAWGNNVSAAATTQQQRTMMERKLGKASTNRRPKSFGPAASNNSAYTGRSLRSTTGKKQRTLPHIAGPGVKGARGVRQAW